jgi:hypothetical protein
MSFRGDKIHVAKVPVGTPWRCTGPGEVGFAGKVLQTSAEQVQFLDKKCCKEMHDFSLFHREFHLAMEVWQHPMEVQIQPPKFWECQNGCCPNVWLCLGETHGEMMVLMAGFRVPHFVDLPVANVLQIPWLDRIGIPSLIQLTLEQRLPSALLRTFNLGAGRS